MTIQSMTPCTQSRFGVSLRTIPSTLVPFKQHPVVRKIQMQLPCQRCHTGISVAGRPRLSLSRYMRTHRNAAGDYSSTPNSRAFGPHGPVSSISDIGSGKATDEVVNRTAGFGLKHPSGSSQQLHWIVFLHPRRTVHHFPVPWFYRPAEENDLYMGWDVVFLPSV